MLEEDIDILFDKLSEYEDNFVEEIDQIDCDMSNKVDDMIKKKTPIVIHINTSHINPKSTIRDLMMKEMKSDDITIDNVATWTKNNNKTDNFCAVSTLLLIIGSLATLLIFVVYMVYFGFTKN